jgi:hypothetical protein
MYVPLRLQLRYAVMQLVALRYGPECRVFDFQ